MKKLLTLSICAVLGLSAMAQQLPNADFEEAWIDCVPWTSNGNTTVQGTTPTFWNVSNTIGTGGKSPMGNTTIAEKVDGYNSNGAVKVFNKEIKVVFVTKSIPGYFGLGTSWATSVMTSKMAGGQFGGAEFTYRPDALQFMYQSSGSDQPTVLAYFWNGTFVQKDVSGNIVMGGTPKKVDMQNRDRNILGMEAPEGGEVTQKGTLIASINTRINAETTGWTKALLEFGYVSDENPEMINVVFAAGDYFSTSPVKDNSITVDDVKLIYYSRLNSLKVADQEVALEDGKYEYAFDFEMPETDDAFVYELKGKSAEATVTRDEVNHTATIKVTNVDADTDGLNEHNYVLAFAEPKPAEPIEGDRYDGNVTIGLEAIGLGEDQTLPATVYIVPDKNDESKCTIMLPNFSLGEGANLGDIIVPNVTKTATADGFTYEGVVNPLHLTGAMDIYAKVTVEGTTTNDGDAHMNIHVLWLSDPENDPEGETSGVPIEVEFNGKLNSKTSVDDIYIDNSEAAVEYYNLQGIRVANPENGIYIRRQGNKVSKVYVK